MNREGIAARRAEVARRCTAGESRSAVALDTGLSLHTVNTACRVHGVPTDGQAGNRTGDLAFRILADAMREPEANYRDIGARYGVTKQRVQQVVSQAARAGVPGLPEKENP